MTHRTNWQAVRRTSTGKRTRRASRRLFAEMLEDRKMLAVFTVSNLNDAPVSAPGDAPGTLRQAIFDANATVGADSIEFQAGLSGTITLNQGELTIIDDLTINGPGATEIAIDASGNDATPAVFDGQGSRVLNIDDGNISNDIAVSISGLTITGGDVTGNGGGIRAAELLTLSNSVITGNAAISSSFGETGNSGNGGGVASYEGMEVDYTLADYNYASNNGGAFWVVDDYEPEIDIVVYLAVFAGNAAGNVGGAIQNNGNMVVSNSTITGNSAADGGGIANSGPLDMSDTSINGNDASNHGGGLFNDAAEDVFISDSDFENNEAGNSGGGIYNDIGAFEFNGGTISGNSAGYGGGVANAGDADFDGTIIEDNEADHDGGGIFVDDDGALLVISGTVRGNSATDGGGLFNDSDEDIVIGDTIFENNEAGNDGGGIFNDENSNLVVTDSAITSNTATDGGGLFNDGQSDIDNVLFDDNEASNDGGGINSSGDLTAQDCTVSGNSAGQDGGGMNLPLSSPGSFWDVGSCDVVNNTAAQGGGVNVSNYYGQMVFLLNNCNISGNTATSGTGGGLWLKDTEFSQMAINSCTFAANNGGGFFFYSLSPLPLNVTNSTVSGNDGSFLGGGVFVGKGNLNVNHSTITGNTTSECAGGMFISNDTQVTLNHAIVANNYGPACPANDILGAPNDVTASYSLIGERGGTGFGEAPVGSPDANGNIIGGPTYGPIDPGLTALGNYCSTQCHALTPNSPAVDAGDPNAVAGQTVPGFDQRGEPYMRIANPPTEGTPRIDIGSFELQEVLIDGDFNDDGLFDCADINALIAEIASGNHNAQFDLDGDGLVNLIDRDLWLAEAGGVNLGLGKVYLVGDANLDGVVDGQDFIDWNANKFTALAAWCGGDFNADGVVDGQDFLLWNANKFTSSDRLLGPQVVLGEVALANRERLETPVDVRAIEQNPLAVETQSASSPSPVWAIASMNAVLLTDEGFDAESVREHDVNREDRFLVVREWSPIVTKLGAEDQVGVRSHV